MNDARAARHVAPEARLLALDWVRVVLIPHARERKANPESEVLARADALGREDRALFQELTIGLMREWGFLNEVLLRFAKRPPREKLRNLVLQSAYSLLFLDRIPAYAVFSEAKRLASLLGLSEHEAGFAHGVLKQVERNREAILKERADAMAKLKDGARPSSAFEWAVLNSSGELLRMLNWCAPGETEADAQSRAVRALAAMKEPLPLVGYVLPGMKPSREYARLGSTIAPDALILDAAAIREDPAVRVQGEVSQWVCLEAAKWIAGRARESSAPVRVLEMASGKGGKLLGTLAALARLSFSAPESRTFGAPEVQPFTAPEARPDSRGVFSRLEWWAADSSDTQLRFFERDAFPRVRELWPDARVRVLRTDFSDAARLPVEFSTPFDLVWLDAPCTGFGTLAKHPQIAWTRGLHARREAESMAALQHGLVEKSAGFLASGGTFLYSVCTLTEPETSGVTHFANQKLRGEPVWERVLWPGDSSTPASEGFYAALLQKPA
ncbi:MAG: hypothetical protein HYW49_01385 [Deltaproteobacteria bacterium]|nr:hypothetical protein [Deltaproteobacteria bacterium]